MSVTAIIKSTQNAFLFLRFAYSSSDEYNIKSGQAIHDDEKGEKCAFPMDRRESIHVKTVYDRAIISYEVYVKNGGM